MCNYKKVHFFVIAPAKNFKDRIYMEKTTLGAMGNHEESLDSSDRIPVSGF